MLCAGTQKKPTSNHPSLLRVLENLRHLAAHTLRTHKRHSINLQMRRTRQRATPRFTHKRLSISFTSGTSNAGSSGACSANRTARPPTPARRSSSDPLRCFNLPLRLLQRNNGLKSMLKLRDFVALSNTENGRKRADWKYLKTWPRRAFLPGSME